ncbi:MAG: hypothetical protein K9N21_10440 [Deltaproteobacteria bacterium]|nr:hypothetical protein [Deltaproteobacteria bacterium]
MPKKGYKQSKEHIKKRMPNASLKKKPKKKKKAKLIEETPPAPYRDYRCDSYQICLRNAAFFDLVLDCTDCQNCKHAEPKPSPIYDELVTIEAVACTHLLRAIFAPQSWRLEERAKERAMKKGPDVQPEDQPEIQWWG